MLHNWYCGDHGSATEIDLSPGRYTVTPGCTVDRVKRDAPPVREDYAPLCDIEWVVVADRGPAATFTPVRVSKAGAFTVAQPGIYRITRPAGVSTLTVAEAA